MVQRNIVREGGSLHSLFRVCHRFEIRSTIHNEHFHGRIWTLQLSGPTFLLGVCFLSNSERMSEDLRLWHRFLYSEGPVSLPINCACDSGWLARSRFVAGRRRRDREDSDKGPGTAKGKVDRPRSLKGDPVGTWNPKPYSPRPNGEIPPRGYHCPEACFLEGHRWTSAGTHYNEDVVLTILGFSDRNAKKPLEKDGEWELMKLCSKMSTLGNKSGLQNGRETSCICSGCFCRVAQWFRCLLDITYWYAYVSSPLDSRGGYESEVRLR